MVMPYRPRSHDEHDDEWSRPPQVTVQTHGANLGYSYRAGLITRLQAMPCQTLAVACALNAWSLYITSGPERKILDLPTLRRIFIEAFVAAMLAQRQRE